MIYIGVKRKRREHGGTYWSFGREKEDSRQRDFFLRKLSAYVENGGDLEKRSNFFFFRRVLRKLTITV